MTNLLTWFLAFNKCSKRDVTSVQLAGALAIKPISYPEPGYEMAVRLECVMCDELMILPHVSDMTSGLGDTL